MPSEDLQGLAQSYADDETEQAKMDEEFAFLKFQRDTLIAGLLLTGPALETEWGCSEHFLSLVAVGTIPFHEVMAAFRAGSAYNNPRFTVDDRTVMLLRDGKGDDHGQEPRVSISFDDMFVVPTPSCGDRIALILRFVRKHKLRVTTEYLRDRLTEKRREALEDERLLELLTNGLTHG